MGKRSIKVLVAAAALLIALGSVGAVQSVAAADQLQDSAVSVYEVRPDHHLVRVTIRLTLTNRAPSTSRSWDCSYLTLDPYGNTILIRARCTRRTSYYYKQYELWVERDATAFKVKADRGSVSFHPSGRKGDWRVIQLKFSPLFYGKTRKITLTYDLPAGGPRSTAERRVGYGFTSFCATGPGSDVGKVQVTVPAGYELDVDPFMASTTARGIRTYDSGLLKSKPWEFYSCLIGDDPTGYASNAVTTSAGQAVTIEAWKDDKTWADAVGSSVTSDYPALVALLGAPPIGADLTIREVIDGRHVVDDATAHTHTLSEAAASRTAATDDLSHLWLSNSHVNTQWLIDGYATWAQHEIGAAGVPCDKPSALPTGRQELDLWLRTDGNSPKADLDVHAYQRQAACYLISQVAAAMGNERMVQIMGSLRAHAHPWRPDASAALSSPLSWRAWADTVTEQGYRPAGADPAELTRLLLDYGVADDEGTMAARTRAHTAYHGLGDLLGDGPAPKLITDALARWDFKAAQAAIDAATAAYLDSETASATLPSMPNEENDIPAAIAAATTQQELDAARARAATQKTLASSVASALQAREAATDPLQQLGLVGATLPDEAALVSAVAKGDEATATSGADQLNATIAAARDAGMQRAGAGVAGVVVLLGAGWFVVRRLRRASRRTASAGED